MAVEAQVIMTVDADCLTINPVEADTDVVLVVEAFSLINTPGD